MVSFFDSITRSELRYDPVYSQIRFPTSKIIQQKFIYIDKAKFALRLVRQGGYYFLSRQRRFGKSLFISALEEILNGNKGLFKGLHDSLRNQDKKLLGEISNHAFSQIPYDLSQKDNEQFYHAIVHLMFSLLGVYFQSEVHTKKGRADALVEFEDGVYCLEFKLDRSAAEALDQIRERGYTEKYRGSGKTIHHIGINFSSEMKEVEGILWERQLYKFI